MKSAPSATPKRTRASCKGSRSRKKKKPIAPELILNPEWVKAGPEADIFFLFHPLAWEKI
jgi:hypothetical protein